MSGSSDRRNADFGRKLEKTESLSLLVGSLAHDFNNLLSAIVGHASHIEAESPPGSEFRESAEAILKAAGHAASITEQLRSFTHRRKPRREPVDLRALIGEVVSLLKPTAAPGIRFETRVADALPELTADPEQIYQMLLNLVVNATEAMAAGGVVTISAESLVTPRTGRQSIVVEVADTGPGIADDVRKRIFEPFFSNEKRGGSGLGLTIVASIVRQHQGHIEVDTAVAQGSRFRVFLPVKP